MTQHGQRAIVIGASMSSLLAARILADFYSQVTLIERDRFPVPGEHRKGVPQGRHGHGLLGRGREVLEDLLPGITKELIGLGAVVSDNSLGIRWFNNGGYHRPCASGRQGVAISRPLLEGQVRARILALPQVSAIEQCDVLGLVTDTTSSRVEGVRLLRHAPGSAEEVVHADLVVDASGRGSRSPAWLEALGYERPVEEHVRVSVGYTSCTYRRTPEQLPGLHGIVVAASPDSPCGAALLAQEGDRWILSVGVYNGQAPTDPEGFQEYVKTLPVSEIARVICQAERLTEPVAYKFNASQRRHYEQLSRFPDRYLVFGDALCAFNPVYGQGMTVAAQEAIALRACLEKGRQRLALRFFKQAAKLIDNPWSVAVRSDLRLGEVEGKRTPIIRFINWYMEKLHRAAHHDSMVSLAFLDVVNMVAAPSSVLQPRLALRVLWGNLRARRQQSQVDDMTQTYTATT